MEEFVIITKNGFKYSGRFYLIDGEVVRIFEPETKDYFLEEGLIELIIPLSNVLSIEHFKRKGKEKSNKV